MVLKNRPPFLSLETHILYHPLFLITYLVLLLAWPSHSLKAQTQTTHLELCEQRLHGAQPGPPLKEIESPHFSELLHTLSQQRLSPSSFENSLNQFFNEIGFNVPLEQRKVFIQGLTAVDQDFLAILFERIIMEYVIPLSQKHPLPPIEWVQSLERRVQSLAVTDYTHEKALEILLESLGDLRRGNKAPRSEKKVPEQSAPQIFALPLKLKKWGFPLHDGHGERSAKGNAFVLQILARITPERRQEIFQIFNELDYKSAHQLLLEIFESPHELDGPSLNQIKKYPDLFIEALLWDPLYRPFEVIKKRREQNLLLLREKKRKVFFNENSDRLLEETILASLLNRPITNEAPAPIWAQYLTKNLHRKWLNHFEKINIQKSRIVMEKLERWPLYYRKLLIKNFFDFKEDAQDVSIKENLSGFFEILNLPEEIILLNDSAALSKLSSNELKELHLKVLQWPEDYLNSLYHPTFWTNPLSFSIRFLSYLNDNDRRIDRALRSLEDSKDPLLRVRVQLAILQRGHEPKEFMSLYLAYTQQTLPILPDLVRANYFFPLKSYLYQKDFAELMERIQRNAQFEGASDELLAQLLNPDNAYEIKPAWTQFFIREMRISGPMITEALQKMNSHQ